MTGACVIHHDQMGYPSDLREGLIGQERFKFNQAVSRATCCPACWFCGQGTQHSGYHPLFTFPVFRPDRLFIDLSQIGEWDGVPEVN